jgi:hypothetical protein
MYFFHISDMNGSPMLDDKHLFTVSVKGLALLYKGSGMF